MAMGNGSIQFLRGDAAAIATHSSDIPAAGQPVFDLTNNRLYIGNGSDTLNGLPAFATENHLYRHIIQMVPHNESGYVWITLYNISSADYTLEALYNEFGAGQLCAGNRLCSCLI